MNNEDNFEYTFDRARRVSLTREEREEMKRDIRLFMAEHPVKPAFLPRLFVPLFNSNSFISYTRPVLAGVLIVFLVSGSASYAAADALPGDFLYAIKTRVNEPIQGALAVSEEAKADWSTTLAARRLEEAGALALEGRLSAEARTEIETRFEEHAEQFEASVSSLEQEESGIEAAADAQSHLEVSLKAHVDVLAELSRVASEVESELDPIIKKVRSRVAAVESARVATERVIAAKVGKEIEAAAVAKKRVAEREVERDVKRESKQKTIRARAPESKSEAVMTLTASAPVEQDRADEEEGGAAEALRDGSEKLEKGKHGEAFAAFQKALRTVEKKKLDFDVRKRLKIETGTWTGPAGLTSKTEEASNKDDKENGDKNDNEDERKEWSEADSHLNATSSEPTATSTDDVDIEQ